LQDDYERRGTIIVITVARATDLDQFDEAAALVRDLVEWIRVAMGVELLAEQPELGAELAALADHYDGLSGALYLASHRNVAVGTVAVRCTNDGEAELKRMYVRPVARGTGTADLLVQQAIEFAGDAGCTSVWLETARGAMDPAIAVYERNGFTVVGDRPTLPIRGIVVMRRPLEPVACHA
jgi:GNAT superfamily N-acetyltransferase